MRLDSLYKVVLAASTSQQRKMLKQADRKLVLFCCSTLDFLSKNQTHRIDFRNLREKNGEIKRLIVFLEKNGQAKVTAKVCHAFSSFFKVLANIFHLRIGINKVDQTLEKTIHQIFPEYYKPSNIKEMIWSIRNSSLSSEKHHHILKVVTSFHLISLKKAILEKLALSHEPALEFFQQIGLKIGNFPLSDINKVPLLLTEKYEQAKKQNKIQSFFDKAFDPADKNELENCYERIKKYDVISSPVDQTRNFLVKSNNPLVKPGSPIEKPLAIQNPARPRSIKPAQNPSTPLDLPLADKPFPNFFVPPQDKINTIYNIYFYFSEIQLEAHAKYLLTRPYYRNQFKTFEKAKENINKQADLRADFLANYMTSVNFEQFLKDNQLIGKQCKDGPLTEKELFELIDLLAPHLIVKNEEKIKIKIDTLFELCKDFRKIQLEKHGIKFYPKYSKFDNEGDLILQDEDFLNKYANTKQFKSYLEDKAAIYEKKCVDGVITKDELPILIENVASLYGILGEEVDIPPKKPIVPPKAPVVLPQVPVVLPQAPVVPPKAPLQPIKPRRDEWLDPKIDNKAVNIDNIDIEKTYNEMLKEYEQNYKAAYPKERVKNTIDAFYLFTTKKAQVLADIESYYKKNPGDRYIMYYPGTKNIPIHTEFPLAEVKQTIEDTAMIFTLYEKIIEKKSHDLIAGKALLAGFFRTLQQEGLCVDARLTNLYEFCVDKNIMEDVKIEDLRKILIPLVDEKETQQHNIAEMIKRFTEIQARKYFKEKNQGAEIELSWFQKPEVNDLASHPRTQIIEDENFQENYNNRKKFIEFLVDEVKIIGKKTKNSYCNIDFIKDFEKKPPLKVKTLKEPFHTIENEYFFQAYEQMPTISNVPFKKYYEQKFKKEIKNATFQELKPSFDEIKVDCEEMLKARIEKLKSLLPATRELKSKEGVKRLNAIFEEWKALEYALDNNMMIGSDWLSEKQNIVHLPEFNPGYYNQKTFETFLEKEVVYEGGKTAESVFGKIGEHYWIFVTSFNLKEYMEEPNKINYTTAELKTLKDELKLIKNSAKTRIQMRRDQLNTLTIDEKKSKAENHVRILSIFIEQQALEFAEKNHLVIEQNWFDANRAGILNNQDFKDKYLTWSKFKDFFFQKFHGKKISEAYEFTKENVEEWANYLVDEMNLLET